MSSELLAVTSALFFAASFVAGKRGLTGTTIVGSVLVTFGSGALLAVVATLIDPPSSVSLEGVSLFALTGLVAPGIGYSAALAGVHYMGPSIAIPIQQGVRPLIAVSAAAILLGESLSLLQALGILALVAGSVGLSRRSPSEIAQLEAAAGQGDFRPTRLRQGIVFPFTAAVAFAAFDVMVKHGLTVMQHPTFAAAVTVGSAFLGWLVLILFVPATRRLVSFGPRLEWVVLGGVLFASGAVSVFHAFVRGDVALVSPVLASQPLFVLILSRLLLREIESVSATTIAFGILVVVGTILVIL